MNNFPCYGCADSLWCENKCGDYRIWKIENKDLEDEEMAENKHPHEEVVRQIREIGESLIKNAESIAGTEKYLCEVTISVVIALPMDGIPRISISRDFDPERFIERMIENNG